jgi:D-glycero-D-manno-heptose 1,7-bisphosphate phosphatase
MLLDIGQRFNVSLKDVIFIGDSISDVKAASNANAKAVLVRTGKGVKAEKILQTDGESDVPVYDDLAAAVTAILQ